MKKLIALIACISTLLCLLAGCGSGTEVEYYDDEDEVSAVDAADEVSADTDAQEDGLGIMLGGTGYETYAPDTVVGVVDGTNVTWMEYYYWLSYYANYYVQLAQMYGISLTSWDAVGELSSDNANGPALIAMTEYTIRQYHAVSSEADKADIYLTDEERAELESVYDSNCDTDGDGEVTEEEIAAFEEYLSEQHVDKEFFLYLNEIAYLSDKLFDYYYGAQGENCSDDITLDYIAASGAMSAKHILLLTVDSSTREALDEDTVAQKLETAETLQAELAAVRDDKESLIALFDEYMADYTEDTGYAANPDGYVFAEGDMVTEFEDAVKALDENYGLSDVVESPYGYHIIMRQPLTPDTVVGTNSAGEEITFRYVAAEEQFSAMMSAWTDSADVAWNDDVVIDMPAIFG